MRSLYVCNKLVMCVENGAKKGDYFSSQNSSYIDSDEVVTPRKGQKDGEDLPRVLEVRSNGDLVVSIPGVEDKTAYWRYLRTER